MKKTDGRKPYEKSSYDRPKAHKSASANGGGKRSPGMKHGGNVVTSRAKTFT